MIGHVVDMWGDSLSAGQRQFSVSASKLQTPSTSKGFLQIQLLQF